MADKVQGLGRIIAGDQFNFTLDGIATAAQMERLISAVGKNLGGPTETPASRRETMRRNRELQDRLNKAMEDGADAAKDRAKADRSLTEAQKDLEDQFDKLSTSFRYGGFRNIRTALEAIDTGGTRFALGLGYLTGELIDYADKLTAGLQRGISGDIFDYAIMAKMAGVTMEQFGKAIAETGGGFASLGAGATAGAKQFAGLVGEVRSATASVGNLGMTNEQLAEFTAQQTKVAISQGFKGRAAQELVVRNSRDLAEELDILANRTGKSVLELTQAAVKLAQDPIVASFVKSAQQGGTEVSKSVQQFAASLRGVLGELGDTLAADALKSALGGLPFSITQSGKNMLLASSAVYSEFERQASIVRRGGQISAEDQQKLRDTILAEVEARGDELRMLANLEGPIGDSARQMLELAKQANFYNSEAGKQRATQDKVAQEFNAEIRKFQANLQALSIPFLKLLNLVDWSVFIKFLDGFVNAIQFILKPLEGLGNLLGANNFVGTVLGGFAGLVGVLGLVYAAYTAYLKSIGVATIALTKFAATTGYDLRTSSYGQRARGAMPGVLAGAAGIGAGAAIMGMPQSTAGTIGGIGGGIGGSMLGAAGGGALAGRLVGGTLGTFITPGVGTAIGTVVGGAIGTIIGQWLGDAASGSTATSGSALNSIGADDVANSQRLAKDTSAAIQNMDKTMTAMYEQNSVTNAIAGYGNRIASEQVRATTNLGYRLG
jgi:hypothetical protein